MIGATRDERAYIGPFFLFLVLLLGADLVTRLGDFWPHWVFVSPRYWVFPVQTLACFWLVWKNRALIAFGPVRGFGWTLLAGAASFIVWIAPWQWMGFAPRLDGFDPAFFGADGAPYACNVAARFVRLVIIVPLVEEIFWRGFLLRFLISEDFQRVPVGTFTWRSFLVVSVAFCFEHHWHDYAGALITSVLYNLVAYRTRSLFACIAAHAVTNLALGIWVLQTGQYGFW